jgi:hypothetical protein
MVHIYCCGFTIPLSNSVRRTEYDRENEMTSSTQHTRRSFLSHPVLALPTIALADLLARDGLLLGESPRRSPPS